VPSLLRGGRLSRGERGTGGEKARDIKTGRGVDGSKGNIKSRDWLMYCTGKTTKSGENWRARASARSAGKG